MDIFFLDFELYLFPLLKFSQTLFGVPFKWIGIPKMSCLALLKSSWIRTEATDRKETLKNDQTKLESKLDMLNRHKKSSISCFIQDFSNILWGQTIHNLPQQKATRRVLMASRSRHLDCWSFSKGQKPSKLVRRWWCQVLDCWIFHFFWLCDVAYSEKFKASLIWMW